MFLVIMAMFVTSMFVAAAFAAADGDLPMAGASKDRKETYAAAEAGVELGLLGIAVREGPLVLDVDATAGGTSR